MKSEHSEQQSKTAKVLITVFIEGKEKTLDLDETLTIDKENPEIFLVSNSLLELQ